MVNTRVKMIIDTLRDNPHRKFTARELAREFLVRYPKIWPKNALIHALIQKKS